MIQKGLELSQDRAQTLQQIYSVLISDHPEIALEYVRQYVALQPEDMDGYFNLIVTQAMLGDVVGARATLAVAEKVARKMGRKDLLDQLADLRSEISSPMFSMLGPMLARGGLNPFDLDNEDF